MRQTGKSKTCVWRWQERFATEGFEGLLRDKTRPSRIAPLGAEISAGGGADAYRPAGRDDALDCRHAEPVTGLVRRAAAARKVDKSDAESPAVS
ncbi:hypothetical protein ATB98_21340 [Sinorhizobium saheli]|uniref:Uncharacterized protein n=1 Tax=Sinorhizobium saheli TaxID=36856 RepID=A0A178Y212_SINSA|nr:hypothetical protein ATB98_21340 [Sinorhizobium saheli]